MAASEKKLPGLLRDFPDDCDNEGGQSNGTRTGCLPPAIRTFSAR